MIGKQNIDKDTQLLTWYIKNWARSGIFKLRLINVIAFTFFKIYCIL